MLTWLQICWRAMLFVPSSICLGIFPVIIACWIGLCVVLCGVLCLVAIIQSISSGLLNLLFFDYNFFANRKILYQQIILPTIEVFYLCRAGGPLNAVTDRRLPGPRLTNPHPASPSHHVQSCPVQTQMHTQKQTPHQGPSVFAFVMDHLHMGWLLYQRIRDHGSASKSFVSSCLLSKEKVLSRALKHQTQNLLHLHYLRTYLVTMRILFFLIIRGCTECQHFSLQSQSPIDYRINRLFCITLKEQNIFNPPLFCNVLGQSC